MTSERVSPSAARISDAGPGKEKVVDNHRQWAGWPRLCVLNKQWHSKSKKAKNTVSSSSWLRCEWSRPYSGFLEALRRDRGQESLRASVLTRAPHQTFDLLCKWSSSYSPENTLTGLKGDSSSFNLHCVRDYTTLPACSAGWQWMRIVLDLVTTTIRWAAFFSGKISDF